MVRLGLAAPVLLLLSSTPTLPLAEGPLSFERYRDEIEPIFLKPRGGHGPGLSPCVTCHVHNGTPLKLEPLQEDETGGVF